MSAQHDLIIVGGGIAGLTAAVRAIELGIQPLVLEKESQDVYPCNSRQSGGVIHIGFLDPYRQDRSLMDNIETRTGGDHDPVLADALIKNGWRFLDWLKAQNTDFISFNEQEGYRWCIAPPRALRAGVDWEGPRARFVAQEASVKTFKLWRYLSPRCKSNFINYGKWHL